MTCDPRDLALGVAALRWTENLSRNWGVTRSRPPGARARHASPLGPPEPATLPPRPEELALPGPLCSGPAGGAPRRGWSGLFRGRAAPVPAALRPFDLRWWDLGRLSVLHRGRSRPHDPKTTSSACRTTCEYRLQFITTVYARIQGQSFLHSLFLRSGLRWRCPRGPVGLVLLEKQT